MKVMVTGATGGYGKLLVKRLEESPEVDHIVGVSNQDIDSELVEDDKEEEKFEFFKADTTKKRVIEGVFKKNPDLDVIVHLAYDNVPEHQGSAPLETNVFGTYRIMKLAKKYGVKRFVYKSSSAIYGAEASNPALIDEDYPLRGDRNTQTVRDKIEVDMICQLNMFDGTDPSVTVLRFCPIIGEGVRAPVNTLFKYKLVPMVLGFDPMFQIMHLGDVIESLYLATVRPIEGMFNVAGKYTEPLSEAIRRYGKAALPLPEWALASYYQGFWNKKRQHSFPFDLNYLKYSFCVDDSAFRAATGFEPRY